MMNRHEITGENMNKSRMMGLRLLVAVVSCVSALSACAVTPTSPAELFDRRSEFAFEPAAIDAIGDAVSDWQLEIRPGPAADQRRKRMEAW
jgi:hypothetical protein